MSQLELLCTDCEIALVSNSEGTSGLLECPKCHSQVTVPVLLSGDGETLISITDVLIIAEQEIEDLRNQLNESQRVLEQSNQKNGDKTGLVSRLQLQINQLNVERAELRGQLEQAKRQIDPSHSKTDQASPSQAKPKRTASNPSPNPSPRLALLEKALTKAHETIERLEKHASDYAEIAADFEKKLAVATVELREKSEALSHLAGEQEGALEEAARLKEETAFFRREILDVRSQNEILIHERDKLLLVAAPQENPSNSGEIDGLKAELAQMRVELLNAKEAASNYEAEAIEIKTKAERTERSLERVKTSLAETDKQHDRVVAELIDLKRSYAILHQRHQEAVQDLAASQEQALVFSEASARAEGLEDPSAGPQTEDFADPNAPSPAKNTLFKVLGVMKKSK